MIDGSVLQSAQRCFEKKSRVVVKMVVNQFAAGKMRRLLKTHRWKAVRDNLHYHCVLVLIYIFVQSFGQLQHIFSDWKRKESFVAFSQPHQQQYLITVNENENISTKSCLTKTQWDNYSCYVLTKNNCQHFFSVQFKIYTIYDKAHLPVVWVDVSRIKIGAY